VWLERPTLREQQCLANHLLHGRDEAAQALGISPATLRNHLTNLYRRLAIEDEGKSVTAIRAALALGWLSIPSDLIATNAGKGASLIPDDIRLARAERLLSAADALLEEMDTE